MKTYFFIVLVLYYLTIPVFGQKDSDNEVVPDFKNSDTEELLKWEAPKEIQKEYPYYLSGFDEEDSPIWITEMGLWDTRKSAEGGPEREKNFRKYILQFLKRCQDSVKLRSSEDNPVTQFNLIVDMAGYTIRQTSTPKTLGMALWMARQFEQAFSESIKAGYILNGNYVFTTVWNLMKPILGANIYKIDVFGTNKERFIPRLRSVFPKNQLPPWYGGTANYQPVQVYG